MRVQDPNNHNRRTLTRDQQDNMQEYFAEYSANRDTAGTGLGILGGVCLVGAYLIAPSYIAAGLVGIGFIFAFIAYNKLK